MIDLEQEVAHRYYLALSQGAPAIDVSPEAIVVAKQNAKNLGARSRCARKCVCTDAAIDPPPSDHLVITANLPPREKRLILMKD